MIVENGSAESFRLNCPMGIVLDGDENLFIVDQKNHRIVGSGLNEFRCIVGCTGYNGSASNQLLYPRTLSFDSFGNIFVTDTNNNRIQKFLLATNSCGKCHNI
jgi:DNA-binding beta-propeller fold protein YncE